MRSTEPQTHSPSQIIIDVVPLSTIHPSFASALKSKSKKPSSSKKSTRKSSKTQKKSSISGSTKRSKSKKGKVGSSKKSTIQVPSSDNPTATDVESNVDTFVQGMCDSNIEKSAVEKQILDAEKGVTVETSNQPTKEVEHSPDNATLNESPNSKIVEEVLNSLKESAAEVNVVPDVPTSLAQDGSTARMVDSKEGSVPDTPTL
jgi:hypothetical protein